MRLPDCVAALLGSLRFDGSAPDLAGFNEAEWKSALYFFDRHQLTLLPRGRFPESVQRRLDQNLAANRERIRRMKQAFWQVQDTLDAAGIEFVVLKGFANWDRFTADPERRLQYDLDLYCPGAAIDARTALKSLGYESIPTDGRTAVDHLPALVRKTGWQWKGDFFDPEIPLSVELHFRLWDEVTEGFRVPGVEDFWSRRVTQSLDGREYLALDPVDSVGYACLHLLRHLLRGDVRAANVYELAYFLHVSADNEGFWRRWRRLQGAGICFLLAKSWFGCRLHSAAQSEIDLLPPRVRKWFDRYAWSPAEALFHPNKDELWLHLSLLDSFSKKWQVVRRRLAPMRLPGPLDSVFIPDKDMTWAVRLAKRYQYSRYVAGRALFHARALSRMLRIRV